MRSERFVQSAFGRPTRRPGDKWAFDYYLPRPIPGELELSGDTVLALSEADSALGLLNGLGRLIQDPEILLGPFLTREALASSRIEGTKASLSEVFQAEAIDTAARRTDDVAEVSNYLAATRQGLELIETLPITQRLIKQVHGTLRRGVRGEERRPGEFRSSPVWIGAADATPETASFVPPLPEDLPELLTDWERFVNEPSRLPTLVRAALMHYQFETIHPFLDGNGRIGRLLVGLLLISERKLGRPLLYLSGYLEANRDEYYDRLQAVRERAEIQQYLQFFLVAVRRQSEDAVARAGRLVQLRESYYAAARLDRSRVAALIPLLFAAPFVNVRRVQQALGVTAQGARNLLVRAERYRWIQSQGNVGRGGMTIWRAQQVFDTIDSPLSYLSDVSTEPGPWPQ